jgi:hypothetical protein
MASASILWSVIWFLVLLFVGFPVAGFCAGWYILILPFTVCIDGLTVSDNLLQGYHLASFETVCQK